MANAVRDENNVSSLLAVLNTDGRTIMRVTAIPSNHRLNTLDGTTGSNLGPTRALHDENFITTLIAVSSADGVTPVVCYADSSGNLLVKST